MFVDLRALRHDRVTLVERGSPHSLSLMESGKLLPGVRTGNIFLFVQHLRKYYHQVNVIIADPETRGQCGDSNLGEIWVEVQLHRLIVCITTPGLFAVSPQRQRLLHRLQ